MKRIPLLVIGALGLFCVNLKANEIQQLDIVDQLEHRVARDVAAYLGHNRFIVNIDVALSAITLQNNQVNSSQNNQAEMDAYENFSETISSLEEVIRVLESQQPKISEISLPGLPFAAPEKIDIPESEALTLLNKTITDYQNKKPIATSTPNNVAPTLTVSEQTKIDNILVTLVIDETIDAEQLNFVKFLIEDKLNINPFRGDKISVFPTKFNLETFEPTLNLDEPLDLDSPINSQLNEDKNTAMEQPALFAWNQPLTWILLVLVVMFLMMLLLLIRRNQGATNLQSNAQADTGSVTAYSDTHKKPDNVYAYSEKIKNLKQDIISSGLSHPERTSLRVDELLFEPNNQAMLACAYFVLGGSLFRGLFPSVSQAQLVTISQYLDEQQLEDESIVQELSALHLILSKHNDTKSTTTTLAPFQFLKRLNNNQIIYLLQEEEPRIKALVLSQLPANRAADIIHKLTPDQQGQVAFEIGQFSEFPISTFKDIAQRLAKKSLNVPSFENLNTDGTSLMIDLLDNMKNENEHQFLQQLKNQSPEMYYRIRQIYFTFEDIKRTPTTTLKDAFVDLDRKQLAFALMGVDETLLQHCLDSMPNKLKQAVKDEIEFSDVKPSTDMIESARKHIVKHIRALIELGKINMQDLATLE
ncbi:FliG C-terminal domain-containing protein [Marinicellulosiphila megalodicopiae]|uniref:FliG C-terminal domain-containing protein n=1 Tax=Marinicellulosiphila megalodicopiae TaxID=2724896 RepID=UPI003BAFFA39